VGPVPSGPNSAPTAGPPRPAAFRTPPQGRGCTSSGAERTGRTGQRSTLEHHPGDSRTHRDWRARPVLARLPGTPARRGRRRSLERR